MGIYHLSMKPIARSDGRSAVAAAAYRAAVRLTNERDGITHDFARKSGVVHSEIILPEGVEAEWTKDRSALWNAAERAERRKDSRVAREFELALPHELNAGQRLALTREFAQTLADRYGAAVDFAIHEPHEHGDERNAHAHLLMTTRKIERDGLSEKTAIELKDKQLRAMGLPRAAAQLESLREEWEQIANLHLARADLDIRIDRRSHAERGLEIEPTEHQGVAASQMQRHGKEPERARIAPEAARRNAALIREKPDEVLAVVTGEKSVFDRRDVARALHRYLGELGPQEFQNTLAKVMASPALVEIQAERIVPRRQPESARYTTREQLNIEHGMAEAADRLAADRNHSIRERHVDASLDAKPFLSAEQKDAVRHVTGGERIAAVVGLAGAGKSTMLAAAREAWEREGYRVLGAALAGKAAEGVEESSGIKTRTLASWERSWENGRNRLGRGDVLVIDEAGMVSSKQLARFIAEAERAGAKVVLVGDPEQLQAIGAGAAFRAIAERIGFMELTEVRRQSEEWMRQATKDFARQNTAEALAAYGERGKIKFEADQADARAAIVRDYLFDRAARPEGSRVVLAHRRDNVRALNDAIRAERRARGELDDEIAFRTNNGERRFAVGDRILFLENNRAIDVKNGTLGTAEKVEKDRIIVRLDNGDGEGRGRAVSVSIADYAAVDHGYATTIHKAQGATVDRALVLASEMTDRHLAYVAMSRHRHDVRLYASREEFANMKILTQRLSRARAKETTLDSFRRDDANRREQAQKAPERSGRFDVLARLAEMRRQHEERPAERDVAVREPDRQAIEKRIDAPKTREPEPFDVLAKIAAKRQEREAEQAEREAQEPSRERSELFDVLAHLAASRQEQTQTERGPATREQTGPAVEFDYE